jgi:hypothetical protein
MANPGQISNGQITNYISISIWLVFGRGQNFFGHFGRGQTAKRPTANPGQMANVPTLPFSIAFNLHNTINTYIVKV